MRPGLLFDQLQKTMLTHIARIRKEPSQVKLDLLLFLT
jgi:hypothetical protein